MYSSMTIENAEIYEVNIGVFIFYGHITNSCYANLYTLPSNNEND